MRRTDLLDLITANAMRMRDGKFDKALQRHIPILIRQNRDEQWRIYADVLLGH